MYDASLKARPDRIGMATRHNYAIIMLACLATAAVLPVAQGQEWNADLMAVEVPLTLTTSMEGKSMRTAEIDTENGLEADDLDQTLVVYESTIGRMEGERLVLDHVATGSSAFDLLVPFANGDTVPSEAILEVVTLNGKITYVYGDIFNEDGDAEMEFMGVPPGLEYKLHIYGGVQEINPISIEYNLVIPRLRGIGIDITDPSLPDNIDLQGIIDALEIDPIYLQDLVPELDESHIHLEDLVPEPVDLQKLIWMIRELDLWDAFEPQQQSHSYCRTQVSPSSGNMAAHVQTNPYRSSVTWMQQQNVLFNAGMSYYAVNCSSSYQPMSGRGGGFAGGMAAANRLTNNGGRNLIDMSIAYQGGGEGEGTNGFGWSSLTSRGHAYILKNPDNRYSLIDADFDGRNKQGGNWWDNEAQFVLDMIPLPYHWQVVTAFAKYGYSSFKYSEMDSGPSYDLTQSGIRLDYGAKTVQKETVANVEVKGAYFSGEATVTAKWGLRVYGSATAQGAPSQSYDYTFETYPVQSIIYVG